MKISSSTTWSWREEEVEVDYDFYSGSPAVYYPADNAHPEEPPEVDITEVRFTDKPDYALTDDEFDDFETECYNALCEHIMEVLSYEREL